MKHRLIAIFLFASLFPALASTAVATTTWYVNRVSGSNSNSCTSATSACKSIGHAISLAASGDLIKVAPSIYTEHLTIAVNLTIAGAGASSTIIDGGGVGRAITIPSATAQVTLSALTIRHGLANGGGGIFNSGTLSVIASVVSGNTSYRFCTSGCSDSGGGISNFKGARLTITRSTISGNVAALPCNAGSNHCSSIGGGIFNLGSLIVNNSTISGNTALTGGGIANKGNLSVNNSTIAANQGIYGGIGNFSGTATLQNTIVANNGNSGNCTGTVYPRIISNGYNLSSDATCNFSNVGDLNNTDPLLGPLQNNGGPTPTMALPLSSSAVDAGNPNGCTDNLGNRLKTDQRGKPRPDAEDKVGCDVGAYELQSAPGCIPIGESCYGPGPLKCCPAPFPHHSFCSSSTGFGVCLIN